MKKYIIIVLSSLYIYASDIFPVGAVMHALVDENDFQEQMGTEWVLLDGRPVSSGDKISVYLDGYGEPYSNGNIMLPDARGKFIRMMDNGANVDPQINRQIGSYQADGFGYHNHGGGIHNHATPISYELANGAGSRRSATFDGYTANYTLEHFSRDSGSIITGEGESETRPKNIVMNIFVKIRNCQSVQCR